MKQKEAREIARNRIFIVQCPECDTKFSFNNIHGGHQIYCGDRCKRDRDNRMVRERPKKQLTKKQKLHRLEYTRKHYIPIADETPERRKQRLSYKKDYRERHKDKINQKAKENRVTHSARYIEYEVKALAKRRLKFKNDPVLKAKDTERRGIYWKKYLKENLNANITHKLRSRLNKAVRCSGSHKSASTLKLLGCTVQDFKKYFQARFTKGMTWAKFLSAEIHLDHIKPCVAFDLTKASEQKKCFHYTNCQPLWAYDNMVKGGRWL